MGVALQGLQSGLLNQSSAQVIDGSLKFNGSSKNRLDRIVGSVGNQKTWTWSGWIKRNKLADEQVVFTAGASTGGTYWAALRLITDDSLQFINNSSNSTDININTTQRFRDVSSWYHILLRVDITNTTTNDRIDLYINGVKVDDFSTQTQPGTGVNTGINYNHIHAIGGEPARNLYYDTLQMSQVYFIDGQALGPESFGYTDPLTNTWRPKKFKGNLDPNNINDINRTWSDDLSASSGFQSDYPAVNAFDGIFTTNNSEGRAAANNSGSTLTFSPTGGIVVNDKIEVYTRDGTITVNGGSNYTSSASLAWKNISSVSPSTPFTLTSLVVTGQAGNNAGEIYGIKIDGVVLLNNAGWGKNGFYLPMDGNSPIGKDLSNPNPVNDGTAWSSGISGTSGGSSVTVTTPGNAFDGSVSTKATFTHSAGQDSIITWTVPGGGISGSTFRIYCYQPQGTSGANQYLSINGGAYVADTSWNGVSANADGWSASQTIPGGTLTSIALKLSYGGASSQSLYAVEVDGVVLTDGMYGNGWTPVNFGGSNSLDKATGAKPILNTDGGGNVARVGVFGSEVGAYYAVTVAAVGGGNRYHFDGVDRPNPILIRGATYTFDQSDSSNSGHPLRFATAADAAGSSQYTDGVVTNGTPGSAGAYTKITVPHNSPNTLHYYCTNHGGMGSSTSQITDETKADPYAWKNVLALPLVGSANDVSNQINSGSTTKAVTTNGDPTASTTQSNFYGGSFDFDGTGDYFNTSTSSSDFSFGTGDFTIEAWCFVDSGANNKGVWQLSTTSGGLHGATTTLSANYEDNEFYFGSAGGWRTAGRTHIDNTWHHVAEVRSGGTISIYVDGVLDQSWSDTTTYDMTYWAVGGYYSSIYLWSGYIQDFRVYKGVGKYTSDFIPASTSPDILPDTPSGVSGSSKLAKVTDGAVSFDGSGDYLSGPSTDTFVSPAQYTIDGFIYLNSAPGNNAGEAIFDAGSSGGDTELNVMNNNGNIQLYESQSNNTNWNGGASYMGVKRWHYFKQTVNGSSATDASATHKLYIDGKLGVSNTINLSSRSASSVFAIGARTNGSVEIDAIISNFRYRSVLDDSLTVPTEPLTAVTNTKLLCCQSGSDNADAAGTMYKSTTLYTTKADIIANATVLANGGSLGGSDYFYFVPSGNETANGNVFSSNPSFTNTDSSNRTEWYWYNGSGWTETAGGYSNSDYTNFVFKDDTESYGLLQSRDFYALAALNSTAPTVQGGTAPTLNEFPILNATVSPSVITRNGDASATTLNPFTTDINAVRGQETGYCTYSPLDKAASHTVSEGNLKVTCVNDANALTRGTIATPVDSGKWYWENELTLSVGAGFGAVRTDNSFDVALWTPSSGYGYYSEGPSYTRKISGGTQTSYGDSFVVGDTIGVALDLDNSEITFYKNGVSQGVAFSSLASGSYAPAFSSGTNSGTAACKSNFGQKPFKFPPPAGYQPLNGTTILPETVITRPDQFVAATLYTSNNNTLSVSDYQFQPDLLIFKNRDTANHWGWFDSVRGANKQISSNRTNAEITTSGSGYGTGTMNSFDRNGFTLGDDVGSNVTNYPSGDGHVVYGFNAGGNKNTFNVDDVGYASAAAAGLTGGSITPTGSSVGTKQGFSIIKYTGNGNAATIPHGLSQTPTFLIKKFVTASSNWDIWTPNIGADKRLTFTNAATSSTTSYQNVNASTFDVHAGNNDNTVTMIAYLWHDVPGLQKFGSYSGNGSATNGTFIELGFKPAVVIIKNYVGYTEPWLIFDNKRNTFNPTDNYLIPNTNVIEADDYYPMDFLSNGFKLYNNAAAANSSGNSAKYIYAAWAEAPTFNLYGGQSNAR